MFCLVMGGVESIFMPFGTILGVFTISVLMRESVKQLFTANTSSNSGSAGQLTVHGGGTKTVQGSTGKIGVYWACNKLTSRSILKVSSIQL